jgi:hypothetical protein
MGGDTSKETIDPSIKVKDQKKICAEELGALYSDADADIRGKLEFLYTNVFIQSGKLNGSKNQRMEKCKECIKKESNCYYALERLMDGSDRSLEAIRNEYSLEYCFNGALKEWKTSTIFNKGTREIQRIQRTACCHLHAAISMQYYLTEGRYGMIDFMQYVRTSSPELIEKYLFSDSGSSVKALRNMLQDGSKIDAIGNYVPDNEFIALFERYGPFLISRFEVSKDFADTSNKEKYDFTQINETKLNEKEIGLHAMVIVGCRIHKGNLILLVQNWWDIRPFFITSRDFLEYHHAEIYFCRTKQMKKKDFIYNDGLFAEALDFPETFDVEDI